MILPKLTKQLNKRKNNNSNEQKVQLSMGISLININMIKKNLILFM